MIALHLIATDLSAQITIEQAYAVDSLLAHRYLKSVVLHSENINSTQDESVMTWDAVNGRYDGTSVAHSFAGKVDEGVAMEINEVTGIEYVLFNLDSIADTDQYQEVVEDWLAELGLPVGIVTPVDSQMSLYPNTTNGKLYLSFGGVGSGSDYSMKIYDLNGRVVKKTDKNTK